MADVSRRRWLILAQNRPGLVALARRLGAGDQAEDIAQEAIMRAALYSNLDESRSLAFLMVVTTRLAVDLHRRDARFRRLNNVHAARTARDETFEDHVVDRAEAVHAAQLLRERTSAEVMQVVEQRANGMSWADLAAQRGVTVRALETRVRRALLDVRREIRGWRNPR